MIAPIDCMMRVHRPAGRFVFESSLVIDVIAIRYLFVRKRVQFSSF